MDDANAGPKPDPKELEPRPPLQADLVALCRELNRLTARYVVVGGFEVLSRRHRLRGSSPAVVLREIDGVSIPFASPRLLWRMKVGNHQEKDAADLVFLHHWFEQRGEQPPPV